MPKPNEVSAGGVVALHTEAGWHVCLVRVGDRWEIPKGHPNQNETLESTAAREISEETGIPLESLSLNCRLTESNYVYRRDGRLVFKRVYAFLFISGSPHLSHQTEEVDDAQWLSLTQAREQAAFKDTKALIDEAAAVLTTINPASSGDGHL